MVTNNLKTIRMNKGTSHSTLSKKLNLSTSEIYEIENNEEGNTLYYDNDLILKICKYFNVTQKELFNPQTKIEKENIKSLFINKSKVVKYLFLDSSTIMNQKYFAHKFLKYFTKLCIVPEVQDELNYHKESLNEIKSYKGNEALKEINKYKEYIEFDFDSVDKITRDEVIYYTAYEYAKKNSNIEIYLVSDDKTHTSKISKLKNFTILKGKDFNEIVDDYNKYYDKEKTKTFWKYLSNGSLSSVMRMDLEEVDINSLNPELEITPLCYAISKMYWEVAAMLIKRPNIELDVVGCAPNGYGAIHYAVNAKHFSFVKLLEEHGAYLALMSKHAPTSNVTPLMIASSKGKTDIVEYLLNKGVSINQQDTDGNTALHRAAMNGFNDIYDLLLEEEADYNILNCDYCIAEELL